MSEPGLGGVSRKDIAMARSGRLIALLAVVGALSLAAPVAAHADAGQVYTATLNQVNGSGGSGSVSISLNGDQATIREHWSGLAATLNGDPFPHAQHIHVAAKGECPTMAADKNGDGVISNNEGAVDFGLVGTTLSVKGDTSPKAKTDVKLFPTGSSTDYARTITLDNKTVKSLKDDTAVAVVHGLDPSTLSKKAQQEKSPLAPSLPLAATAVALCGPLHLTPVSGPSTGTGSTAGVEHSGLIAGGAGLVLAAGAAMVASRRRRSHSNS